MEKGGRIRRKMNKVANFMFVFVSLSTGGHFEPPTFLDGKYYVTFRLQQEYQRLYTLYAKGCIPVAAGKL